MTTQAWVFLGYFLVVFGIGWYSLRATRDETDYWIAGGELGWFTGGATMAATHTSAGTFVGTIGVMYTAGWSFGWVLLSIPLAYWFMVAVLAPRFLASAFASGPALLIVLCLVLRRVASFDVVDVALGKLAKIMTYAMILNVFLLGLELFTAAFSGSPEHLEPWLVLFWRVDGSVNPATPLMWFSLGLALAAVWLLLRRATHRSTRRLAVVSSMVFVSIWIDKGAGMMTGGLSLSPLGSLTHYIPSLVEIVMGIGLYAFGALILTALFKVAITVRTRRGAAV